MCRQGEPLELEINYRRHGNTSPCGRRFSFFWHHDTHGRLSRCVSHRQQRGNAAAKQPGRSFALGEADASQPYACI